MSVYIYIHPSLFWRHRDTLSYLIIVQSVPGNEIDILKQNRNKKIGIFCHQICFSIKIFHYLICIKIKTNERSLNFWYRHHNTVMELVWLQFPCDFHPHVKISEVAPSTRNQAYHLNAINKSKGWRRHCNFYCKIYIFPHRPWRH